MTCPVASFTSRYSSSMPNVHSRATTLSAATGDGQGHGGNALDLLVTGVKQLLTEYIRIQARDRTN